MASEWGVARMSDVAVTTDYVANGSFDSLRRNVTYKDSPDYAVLVRLVDHNATWNGPFVYVDKASYDFLRKSSLVPGDIVIANVGANAGTVFRVPSLRIPMTLGPNAILCRPMSANVLNRDFLYYYLSSTDGQELLHSIRSGSAQPKFNKTDLRALPIPVPPLGEQQDIARILGTLDDKIELNRRLNETLEAAARALFKSWFVDFDPVRAKCEGRDPGLPRHLADLFPDSFDDSELGEIPTGWRTSKVGDEVQTVLGGTPSRDTDEYWGGDIPWINSGKANEFRIVDPSEFISKAGLDSSSTKLLPSRTTVIAITGATLGQVSLTEIATCANQSIVGVVGSKALPSEFLYPWVKENITRLISSQTGGAQQHINKNDVNELPLLCPPARVVGGYVERVRPLFDRIRASCFETRHLVELRDALRPKLVTGEIRLGLAERETLGPPG